jgi:hypothetical protein
VNGGRDSRTRGLAQTEIPALSLLRPETQGRGTLEICVGQNIPIPALIPFAEAATLVRALFRGAAAFLLNNQIRATLCES